MQFAEDDSETKIEFCDPLLRVVVSPEAGTDETQFRILEKPPGAKGWQKYISGWITGQEIDRYAMYAPVSIVFNNDNRTTIIMPTDSDGYFEVDFSSIAFKDHFDVPLKEVLNRVDVEVE